MEFDFGVGPTCYILIPCTPDEAMFVGREIKQKQWCNFSEDVLFTL